MDKVLRVVDYITDYLNSIPAESWYALGVLLGGSAIVTGIVAWINRRRLKKGLEKLGKAMASWVVVFLSAVVSLTGWIVLNGPTFSGFLGPWAAQWLKIIAVATLIYNFAKPLHKQLADKKAISNPNMPTLSEQLEASSTTLYGQNAYGTMSGQPSSSLGTQAAGIDVVAPTPPPANLFD